ncbi:MAG: hypothetical protein KGL10_04590 [Alphaproteobacteria bacterium]|nr:hypothetical protein [Alphaproteobacteria bacterium]MDE2336567.1 hypothetical protein [Alphaproteobacteria bacterium]
MADFMIENKLRLAQPGRKFKTVLPQHVVFSRVQGDKPVYSIARSPRAFFYRNGDRAPESRAAIDDLENLFLEIFVGVDKASGSFSGFNKKTRLVRKLGSI